MFGKPVEEDMTTWERLKLFLPVHWKGLVCFFAPIFLVSVLSPFPPKDHQWTGYCLILMAIYWVTGCIPLTVTAFLPVAILPLAGVMTTTEVCAAYINDSVLMFVGSIMLAYSVEQSGLHKRLAYWSIRCIGYSHLRLLLAVSCVTMFVSMWVTNTAATTMMVPINFAVLKVFDQQKLMLLYEKDSNGEDIASDITTAYFCATTFAATIGGIGTLVGTGTNLAFKGVFQTQFPDAPEYLSFPLFSGFAVPYMIAMEASVYLIMAIQYFGLFRPSSNRAIAASITEHGAQLAKKAILEDYKKMGKFTFWEGMVLILFTGAMVCFFCRSPKLFDGWGDLIHDHYNLTSEGYVKDSALAALICFLMFLLPSSLKIFDNCSAKFSMELPGRITSVLDWGKLNAAMPYSYMFLLGGGFAMSEAAKVSGLNDKIGDTLTGMSDLPNCIIIVFIIIIVTCITNFGSNVAVATVMVPIAMTLAREVNQNPLWYCIAAGFSASYCFMIPVGTPGNLIVQSTAKIPTIKMIKAGAAPTVAVIIWSWIFIYFYAPVIWPELNEVPEWAKKASPSS